MKKLLLASACCLLSYMGSAQADLVVDIENVNGYAQFTLSGTDTITNNNSIANGFWIHDLIPNGLMNGTQGSIGYNISSGSAAFLLNGGSYSIDNVHMNDTATLSGGRIGFRNASGLSHPNTNLNGYTIGLTGTILTTMSYSVFNDGASMSLGYFNAYDDSPTTLAGSVNVNVGSAQIASYQSANAVADVSALNPLAAMGLGLFALGFGARRLKK
jgi:hypothetical protein